MTTTTEIIDTINALEKIRLGMMTTGHGCLNDRLIINNANALLGELLAIQTTKALEDE